MKKKNFISYVEGSDDFLMKGETGAPPDLRVPPQKIKEKLEMVRDMVLFRYSNTGCQDVIAAVANLLKLIPVYPVHSLTQFTSSDLGDTSVFKDVFLLPEGSPARSLGRLLRKKVEGEDEYVVKNATGLDGRQLGAGGLLTKDISIVKIQFAKARKS